MSMESLLVGRPSHTTILRRSWANAGEGWTGMGNIAIAYKIPDQAVEGSRYGQRAAPGASLMDEQWRSVYGEDTGS